MGEGRGGGGGRTSGGRAYFKKKEGMRDSSVTGVQTCALPISSVCEIAPAVELPPRAQLRKLMIPPPLWPAWMASTPRGRLEQLRSLRRALRRWRAKDQQQQ